LGLANNGVAIPMMFMMLDGCVDYFVLFPSTGPEDAQGAVRQYVPFEQGHVEILRARSPGAQDREPEAFVLAFVGNAARAEQVAAWEASQWKEKPVEVWAVNYPGYGKSTGPAKLRRFPGAALAAYDAVRAQADGRRVFVKGESLGTTVALHVAARRKVDGVVLRSPVPLRTLILGCFGWWNLWVGAGAIATGIPPQLDSLINAPQVGVPGVFILIEPDEIVPVSYQRMVVDAYSGQRRVIERATDNHNGRLTTRAQRELSEAMEWLWGN
jgi:pimeloyl-ACP methyl ester carboxylesterase